MIRNIFFFRYCDIKLRIIANSQTSPNVGIIVDMSLHREYTEGCLPEWIVTRYNASYDVTGV